MAALDMIKVKSKEGVHFTGNASNGAIIHFDAADWAHADAKEPTIPLRDYKRFLAGGVIERSDEAEALLREGDETFIPAGMMMVSEEQLDAIVDRRIEARYAAMGGASKALTAYPANQPVGQIEGEPTDFEAIEEGAPLPPGSEVRRGRGRPRKDAAQMDAPVEPMLAPEGAEGDEPIVEGAAIDPDAPPAA